MNRERLKILRDHLASLPDEQVDMSLFKAEQDCGTVACIAGWAASFWLVEYRRSGRGAADILGITTRQANRLFTPHLWRTPGRYTRLDAVAAIDSMLASDDDDALPVWPEPALAKAAAPVGEG